MIETKLNEIPVKNSTSKMQPDFRKEAASGRGTQGLSIRDTIAGDSARSVGARGVDTSGVQTGAGVAAGAVSVTPSASASPAPAIVPGARLNANGQSANARADTRLPGTGHTDLSEAGRDASDEPTWDEISLRAYEIWCEQGCPMGSCDNDWRQAEEELRSERLNRSHANAAWA
jgi:Protein of unknown function (DUF2934)